MHRYKLLLILILSLFFSNCKKQSINPDYSTANKTTLLTQFSWVIDGFTGINGEVISEGKLNVSAKLLNGLEFQFKTNNQVKAVDKISKQVFSGGTWELSADEKNIQIDIPGLKDNFGLIEITKNKLVLRPNEKVFPVVDKETIVNMVFKTTI